MRKNKVMFVVSVFLILIAVFSASYAIFKVQVSGTKNFRITVGSLDFEIQNEKNAIRLSNAYPMTDATGQTLTPYTFTLTNTGDMSADYTISLVEDTEQKNACVGCQFLTSDKLRFSLKEGTSIVSGPALLSSNNSILTTGSINIGETKNFELRLWLREDATIEEENKYYFSKIKIDTTQQQ